MRTAIYILLAFTLIAGGVAAALWLSPASVVDSGGGRIGFGLYDGRELVELADSKGNTCYVVEDGEGRRLFNIPVRNCLLDVRYRNGRLLFKEVATGRKGYIDKRGVVTFFSDGRRSTGLEQEERGQASFQPREKEYVRQVGQVQGNEAKADRQAGRLDDKALRSLKANNPFYREAARILSGKLDEGDAARRRVILNYCEHFRMAYVTKDIDFLRQTFSPQALIIVGNVVKASTGKDNGYVAEKRVEYYLRTKDEYIRRLASAFAANKKVDVKFSDFRIMRHPTIDCIYGVSLRQRYSSDKYSDDGWLFLLWDFRDEAMPCIHVRTWQPAKDVHDGGDVISISDFNME